MEQVTKMMMEMEARRNLERRSMDWKSFRSLGSTLKLLRRNKPGDRSKLDREYQIAITSAEDAIARFYARVLMAEVLETALEEAE